MIIELPGGIQDGEGTWTKEVELTEVSAVEENILADSTTVPGKKKTPRVPMRERILKILSACTLRVGAEIRPDGKTPEDLPLHFYKHWKNVALEDRHFAWIWLRRISVLNGDEYNYSTQCPHCDMEMPKRVADLSEQTVTNITLEEASNTLKHYDMDGIEVTWSPITGNNEEALEKIITNNLDELRTGLLALRVKSIGGKKADALAIGRLKRKQTQLLNIEFDRAAYGYDLDIVTQCSNEECKKDFTDRIPVERRDFFFPKSETKSP